MGSRLLQNTLLLVLSRVHPLQPDAQILRETKNNKPSECPVRAPLAGSRPGGARDFEGGDSVGIFGNNLQIERDWKINREKEAE